MRPTRVLAGAFVAVVAAAGSEARSDATTSPPPTFNLWNRPGIWHVTTQENAPIGIGDGTWNALDSDGAPSGNVLGTFPLTVDGKTLDTNFNGVSTGTGQAVKGTVGGSVSGTDQTGLVQFAVKMSDSARYEQFTGKYFPITGHGVHFSGTYQPGPVTEETGSANLRLLLFATPAQHTLGSKKIKNIRLKDLPASFAIVGVVQNTGPDLLPRGVAKMHFEVNPGHATDVTLPAIWRVDRVLDPFTYESSGAFDDAWVDEIAIGALGSKKDRSALGIECDVGKGFPADAAIHHYPMEIHVKMSVVSNSPNFKITTIDVSSTTGATTPTLTIPIVPNP